MAGPVGVALILAALAAAVAGRPSVAQGNYRLSPGDRVAGDLLILSGNVEIAEGSAVGGSLLMLCCNATIDGAVRDDVAIITGNLRLGAAALVQGDTLVGSSANFSAAPGATVEGSRVAVGPLTWLALLRALCLAPALMLAALAAGVGWLWGRRRLAAGEPDTSAGARAS